MACWVDALLKSDDLKSHFYCDTRPILSWWNVSLVLYITQTASTVFSVSFFSNMNQKSLTSFAIIVWYGNVAESNQQGLEKTNQRQDSREVLSVTHLVPRLRSREALHNWSQFVRWVLKLTGIEIPEGCPFIRQINNQGASRREL